MRISDWSSDVCSSDLTRVDAAFFLRHSAAHRVEEAMDSPFRAVLSPCIGVCTMAEDGYCDGCHRTSTEIASWIHMDDDARLRLMEDVLPEREARRPGSGRVPPAQSPCRACAGPCI